MAGTGKTTNKRITKKQKEELQEKQKKAAFVKGIALVFFTCLCLLMLASCFVEQLGWMKTACSFLFGIRMYIMPILLAVLAWLLVFIGFTKELIRRTLSSLLMLFAIAGIFAAALGMEKGGLLGRLNYVIFFNLLGKIGSYIVNFCLITVGLILFFEFSFIDYAKEKKRLNEEDEAYQERRKLAEERRNLKKEDREVSRQEHKAKSNKQYQHKNKRYERELENRKKRLQERDRFAPVTGIGDTLITDDAKTSDAAESRKIVSVKKEQKDTFTNLEPNINFGNHVFADEKQQEEKIEPAAVPVKKPIPVVKKEKKQENAEIEFPEIQFTDSDDIPASFVSEEEEEEDENLLPSQEILPQKNAYTKTVETANGKLLTFETDGDILAGKERIQGKKGANEIPYDFSEEAGRNHTGSSASRDTASAESSDQHEQGKPEKAVSAENKAENKADNSVFDVIEAAQEKEPEKEYEFPPLNLLKKGSTSGMTKNEVQAELKNTAQKLQDTLETFGVRVKVTNISCGPSVTRYEIQPEMGVKVSKIVGLTDDIKLNLAAADIRMEAPIPGKSAIGIEIPNKVKQGVSLRDLLESDEFKNAKSKLSVAAGRDIEGNTIIANIEKMPHVLVAGSTGSGKSVCINTMIMSILYHAKPTEVKMILVDPKVVEFQVYNGIPHLLLPVVTDPKKAAGALNWAVAEMERRYQKFAHYNVRGIEGFNDLVDRENPEDNGEAEKKMPQILIVVDEFADLMMVAPGDVETAVCRLAQKARAAGIHLLLATQRPSVDVITGLIKANIPSRIALSVSSGTDSRTIIDMIGAEKLLGNGDMLYYPAGYTKPLRVQGAFVSDDEVSRVVEHIKKQGAVQGGGVQTGIDLSAQSAASSDASGSSPASDRDEFFADAGRLIIDKQKASIGMLQRAFKLGFNRAARIVDQLYDAGVVGEEEGTKPRKVLMTIAEFEDFLQNENKE